MADIQELPIGVRLFLKTYRWRRISPLPQAKLSRPLADARVAVVTSAGFAAPGQPGFDLSARGGDTSYREIDAGTRLGSLVESHRSESFDHSGIQSDPNLAFPLDRFRELVAAGRIGELSPRHFSVMGSITAPGRLMTTTAPEIARKLREDRVDAVLLVPV